MRLLVLICAALEILTGQPIADIDTESTVQNTEPVVDAPPEPKNEHGPTDSSKEEEEVGEAVQGTRSDIAEYIPLVYTVEELIDRMDGALDLLCRCVSSVQRKAKTRREREVKEDVEPLLQWTDLDEVAHVAAKFPLPKSPDESLL